MSLDLSEFEFHDACDGTHPDVIAIQEQGKVASYPPCFRCGKNSCGKDDCNNVLITPQIATFVSYLRLWAKIAAEPQRALVLEDDVFFHSHWQDVLAKVKQHIDEGKTTFLPDVPTLLRFGWALNDEHRPDYPFEVSSESRQSNPCHGLTSAYAQAALDRFEMINIAADGYLHRICPRAGEAFTVFPPIASELSWSVGQFQSLIHPKAIHADYLEKQGKVDEAADQRKLVNQHRKIIAHR